MSCWKEGRCQERWEKDWKSDDWEEHKVEWSDVEFLSVLESRQGTATGPRPFLWIFHSWPPTICGGSWGGNTISHGSSRAPPRTDVHTHTLSLSSPWVTVRADTALFGQPLLVISARLYSQSMVAHTHTQSPHCHEDHVCLCLSGLHAKWKLGPDPSPPWAPHAKERPGRQQDKRPWLY